MYLCEWGSDGPFNIMASSFVNNNLNSSNEFVVVYYPGSCFIRILLKGILKGNRLLLKIKYLPVYHLYF